MIKVPYVDIKGQHSILKKEILAVVEKALEKSDFISGRRSGSKFNVEAYFCSAFS